MLQNQLARGNNGLIKTKYLTFGIDADSIKAAKPRLERIEDVYKRQAYDRHHSRAGGLHRGGRAFILRQMPETQRSL